jgi:hypothetical protein
MFFDEQTEREILHNSTSKKPYKNKKIVGGGAERMVGGGDNGVKELKPPKLLPSSSMSGGKRPPTEWQTLLKQTMTEQKLNLKDAIKYIKDNNLYKKK